MRPLAFPYLGTLCKADFSKYLGHVDTIVLHSFDQASSLGLAGLKKACMCLCILRKPAETKPDHGRPLVGAERRYETVRKPGPSCPRGNYFLSHVLYQADRQEAGCFKMRAKKKL